MMRALPFAALLLAGCASVERAPPASVAVAELPAGFALLDRERAAAGTVAELLPLGDPAYAALEARAMAGAPTLEQALARIEAARAGVRGARAEQLPSLDASGTVARERINTRQFGGLPPGIAIDRNRTAFNLGLSAGWDADLFGRLRAGRRAAVARVDAADADAQAVRVSLRADIARAVIDLRAVDAREAVARRDAASAAELVSITRVRSQAGIAPGFDLVRAEALEADVRGRLAGIGAERAAAIGRLVTLTGAPAQVVVDALRGPGGEAAAGTPVLAVPAVLLRARPDVAAAERRLAAADADVAAAAAERFPRLNVTAALGLFALGLGGLFDDEALTGSVGGGLAGPLLDFGRVGSRIDARRAAAREAFAGYRGALFNALGETEAALGTVAAADRRAAALERQAAVDVDATGLARERYRRGLDSFLTVIDAERAAFGSRSNAIEARADAGRARVALYRAIGGEAR